ncbi:hypothetical protein HMPREF1141_0484 [Clostridium sp. MSTE9]|nr:hypothetical protein HMPREF1141_0484 [Clostridium sp. MSTE9]
MKYLNVIFTLFCFDNQIMKWFLYSDITELLLAQACPGMRSRFCASRISIRRIRRKNSFFYIFILIIP